MKRAPSALVLIGGFGVAVAALSVATTAAVVLLAPQPPALRMSPGAAVVALRTATPGYDRRLSAGPPPGLRVTLVEQVLASELHRAPADVRAVWLENSWPRQVAMARVASRGGRTPSAPSSRTVRLPAGAATAFVLAGNNTGVFRMVASPAASSAMRRAMIGLPMPAFAASVRQPDGRWLTVEPDRPWLTGWRLSVLVALAVSLLLLAPLAWLFARRLTRPFRALAGALGDTADAVPAEGPRELREAAAAIAAMRTRLAAEAGERARMLTAIAHDLRTPLTGLRLRIEASPEPQRARMVGDVERMQAMIGEVLTFARDDAARCDRIAVRALLAEIVADMDPDGATLRLAPGEDAHVVVPVPAFRRAIENLVRNAIDYAGGGTMTLQRRADRVLVTVADTGPGIPAAARERLLRPFERGDTSRNRGTGGAGLGLSIVHDFAVRHRGDFVLEAAPGGGTAAMLSLPEG